MTNYRSGKPPEIKRTVGRVRQRSRKAKKSPEGPPSWLIKTMVITDVVLWSVAAMVIIDFSVT